MNYSSMLTTYYEHQATAPANNQLHYNNARHTIRYDTIEEINVDSKAEYTA